MDEFLRKEKFLRRYLKTILKKNYLSPLRQNKKSKNDAHFFVYGLFSLKGLAFKNIYFKNIKEFFL